MIWRNVKSLKIEAINNVTDDNNTLDLSVVVTDRKDNAYTSNTQIANYGNKTSDILDAFKGALKNINKQINGKVDVKEVTNV